MHATTSPEIIDRYDLARRHRGHFFDASTLRFFGSRIAQYGYRSRDGARAYFTTSERFECPGTLDHPYHAEPRRYTVRVMDWDSGTIDTVGTFQQYASASAARRAAERLANA